MAVHRFSNIILPLLLFALLTFWSTTLFSQAVPDDPEDASAIRKIADWIRHDKNGNIVAVACTISEKKLPHNLKHLDGLNHLVELTIGDCPDAVMQQITAKENLKKLVVYSQRLTDFGMESLGKLKSIEELELRATKVTPNGLANLEKLKKLRALTLFTLQATDRTMENLGELKHLQVLRLVEPKITNLGAKHLSKITTLKELDLCAAYRIGGGSTGPDRETIYGSKITDEGLGHIAKLSRLEFLALTSTKTGPGLKFIQDLNGLKTLILDKTNVTDETLAPIFQMKNLERVSLEDTSVTDLGVAPLREMGKLRRLDVGGTKVRDFQVLRKSIPDVRGDNQR